MSPQESQHLHAFLSNFDVTALGEGDTVAGANLLAAMAISLANIQRPGSGLVTRDGATISVGCNMLVSGSFSASLVGEKVISGLGMRQNNLISRFCRTRATGKENGNSAPPKNVPSEGATDWTEKVMQQLAQPGGIADRQANGCWGLLVGATPPTDIQYLQEHPTIFISGAKTAELVSQLGHCHLGRPLMHVGIDKIRDFTRLEQLCSAVMDGRMTAGSLAQSMRGAVLVSDPDELLNEAIRDDLPAGRWTNRMLWLVDGNAGPEPGDAEVDESQVPLRGIGQRFETAMTLAWGRRINDRVSGPLMVECEFGGAQARWIASLKKVEPEFPGITGAARSLLVTLLFGLRQIVDAVKAPDGFQLTTEQVEAFARFLVHRMTNARAAMVELAEAMRRQRLEAKIMRKLAGGPLGLRDLTRRFHRITQAECHDALLDMEASGRVTQSRDKWTLARAGRLAVAKEEGLLLEA